MPRLLGVFADTWRLTDSDVGQEDERTLILVGAFLGLVVGLLQALAPY